MDSSEDDIFEGKSYLAKFSKDCNKKKFLQSSKHQKIMIKKEIPNMVNKFKNIQQNCHKLSSAKKSRSEENFLSESTLKNDGVYVGSYNEDVIPYFSKLRASKRNVKTDQSFNGRDWLQTRDYCSTDGAIIGTHIHKYITLPS